MASQIVSLSTAENQLVKIDNQLEFWYQWFHSSSGCLLYELPNTVPHMPRLLNGVQLPNKAITEHELMEPVMWHEFQGNAPTRRSLDTGFWPSRNGISQDRNYVGQGSQSYHSQGRGRGQHDSLQHTYTFAGIGRGQEDCWTHSQPPFASTEKQGCQQSLKCAVQGGRDRRRRNSNDADVWFGGLGSRRCGVANNSGRRAGGSTWEQIGVAGFDGWETQVWVGARRDARAGKPAGWCCFETAWISVCAA
ncbi:hypothetical protein M0R45_015816 [Rubus argutus]|uniref:Uncharacterized protein n=1 Tax=Rubus argutus TaxID=59490 RepID=A0AAW1XRN8_RUBAR